MRNRILPLSFSATLLVTFLIATVSQAAFDTLPWLGPSSTRSVLDLAGEWRVLKARGVQTTARVRVPFFVEQEGELVLERAFDLDTTCVGKQVWLVAYGVSRECEIWLNDRFVGSHVGGRSSFAIDLDESLLKIPGSNRLRIHILGEYRARDSLPLKHRPMAWHGGTGVALPLYLLFVPPAAVREVYVQTEVAEKGRGKVRLQAELARRGDAGIGQLNWRAELVDPHSGKVLVRLGNQPVNFSGKLRTTVTGALGPVSVQTWSPDEPRLYRLRLSLVDAAGQPVDATELKIGFRSLVSEGTHLFLNDVPFQWKAVELVGSGTAPPGVDRGTWAIETVRQIKGTGCNAVRVVGGPPDPVLVDAADSLGLFVFEEIPLWKVPTPLLERPALVEQALGYVSEMVLRDRSHPSVAAWGLGVGLDFWDSKVQTVLETLRERATVLDSRPTYVVASPREAAKVRESFPTDWVFLDAADRGHRPKLQGALARHVVLPIVGFLPYRPAEAKLPPEMIEENRSIRLLRAGKGWLTSQAAAGLVVRAWQDWRGPSPLLWLGPPPTEWLPYGVLRVDGSRRLQYRVVRSLFAGDEAPKMRFVSFVPERTALFTLLSLIAIGIFLWYFRRDRRFRGNIRRIFIYPSSIYEDVRSSRKIFAYHTFLQGLFASLSFALFASAVLFFLKRSLIFDELSGLLFGEVAGKAVLVWLAWHPSWALVVFTGVGFLILVLVAWFIWILGFVLGYYIPLSQCLTFIFWIATAFLPGILWATVAYRLMILSRGFLWVTLVLWALLALWFFVRLIRGTATVFRRSVALSTAILLGVVLLAVVVVLAYLQHERAFLAYVGYYLARIFGG